MLIVLTKHSQVLKEVTLGRNEDPGTDWSNQPETPHSHNWRSNILLLYSEHHPEDICISYFLIEVRQVKQNVDSVSWGQGL